jgi:hypothetical protein
LFFAVAAHFDSSFAGYAGGNNINFGYQMWANASAVLAIIAFISQAITVGGIIAEAVVIIHFINSKNAIAGFSALQGSNPFID